MYNIAITKENKTDFFYCTGNKPRQYPTLADALVSAQYLGLSRGDVELHFVKEGTFLEGIGKPVSQGKKTGKGKSGTESSPSASGDKGNPETDVTGGHALEEMSKEELLEYAAREEITVNTDSTQEEILAAIQAAGGEGSTTESNTQV